MSEQSAVPANTAEATRDLQNRLGRFARSLGVISGLMLVASLLGSHVLKVDHAPISVPSRIVHVCAVSLAFGAWLLLRGRTLALSTIHALDAALVITLCSCWALVGLGIAPTEPIEFSVTLATTYTLIARSVIVPSTFWRTFVLGTVSIVPALYFIYTRQMSFVAHAPASQVRTFLMFATLWCLVVLAVAPAVRLTRAHPRGDQARTVHAAREDWRGRHGRRLSRNPRHVAPPGRDQAAVAGARRGA
jgi:lipid-A-disaccharide synthase-like uncharacterized protein